MKRKNTIKESDIRKNKLISEKHTSAKPITNPRIKKIKATMNHVKSAHKKGPSPENADTSTTEKLEKTIEPKKRKMKTLVKRADDEKNEKAPKLSQILETARKENNISEETKQVFEKDVRALDLLFRDGVINSTTLERTKQKIAINIKNVRALRKRKMKKQELEDLQKKIDDMIMQTMHAGYFSIDTQEIKQDLDALKKTYEQGLIFKGEYETKKKMLDEKLQNQDLIVSKIDTVFEEYKKGIIKEIDERERKIDELNNTGDEGEIKEPAPNGFFSKIKGLLFKTGAGAKKEYEDDPALKKLDEIFRKELSASAIADMAFVVKGVIEKKIGYKEEFTNEELIKNISPLNIKSSLKDRITSFFKQITNEEYTGNLKENNIPKTYKEARSIMIEIEKLEFDSKEIQETPKEEITEPKKEEPKPEEKPKEETTEPKEEEPNNENEPKKGILDKINNFFGV
ncbi:MAG: hypothetical protein KAT91_01610 [Candidatus Aenigmarchaeota archaeon]|nr:hypothetical protein [Candidatus Aenigmarchaeota archaeon]